MIIVWIHLIHICTCMYMQVWIGSTCRRKPPPPKTLPKKDLVLLLLKP